MLNRMQIAAMFALIMRINDKLSPRWINVTGTFLRGAATTAMEAIGRDGLKWWKPQTVHNTQLQQALVVVAHAMFSELLVRSNGKQEFAVAEAVALMAEPLATVTFDGQEYMLDEMDTASHIELLIGLSVARRVSFPLLATLMRDCGWTWNHLYREHVCKCIFQLFREDHGYNEGKYIPVWDGRPDQEHLSELKYSLDPGGSNFGEQIYTRLKALYPVPFTGEQHDASSTKRG